ncbi:MAG: DsrE/DsrF/DrsH-like family protein [Cellulosilyticaceae bacterium]
MKVVIVGGVAGGASTATRLRRLDEQAEIVMFEKGEYVSFANCGLPYHIGGSIEERSALVLQTPASLKARFNIDVRNLSEVVAVDTQRKIVKVYNRKDGELYEEHYDTLVLSPGAKPMTPPIAGIKSKKIFTLRNLPDMDRILNFMSEQKAQYVTVVGGGFIGIEMAENLRERGLGVNLVEAAPQIIAPVDPEMAYMATEELTHHGVNVILGNGVAGFEEGENGITTKLNDGMAVTSDFIVLAIGVTPDTEFLKDSGIELGARGHILVNEHLVTSVKGVYALGDAIMIKDYVTQADAYVPLAGPANRQGRIVADYITGKNVKYKGTMGTSILKVFDLVVASTGNNAKVLEQKGKVYRTMYLHPSSHAGYYPGAKPISIKVLYTPDGHLLGAQAVGYEDVDKVIDVLAMAIQMNATVFDLAESELAYAPPFLSAKSPANMIGFIGENDINGLSPIVTPQLMTVMSEVEDLTLIDIREHQELIGGLIEGAIHIPLNQLRDQIPTLDKSKTYVVYCAVGQRGHTAVRLMKNNGFKVYNLSGGYKTYKWFEKARNHRNDRMQEMMWQEEVACATESVACTADTVMEGHIHVVKTVDATGMCCPGPLMRVKQEIDQLGSGESFTIKASDPGFYEDIRSWCDKTHNRLVSLERSKGEVVATIEKGESAWTDATISCSQEVPRADGKTIVVFSGDLDKAIASFIIANGAAAMGKKVTLFFTFWGLNILRKPEKVDTIKGFMEKGFEMMMPRGSKKLGLSRMNMGGMGAKMIRKVMKDKNVQSLEELIHAAMASGVEVVACTMSMDVMGIQAEELIEGVKLGGVGYYLGEAEDANVNLFI